MGKQSSVLPLIDSYLGIKDGFFEWLSLISGIILLRLLPIEEPSPGLVRDERSIVNENFRLRALWQVFTPGSWIDTETGLVGRSPQCPSPRIKIIKVHAEPWKVLQDREPIMTYCILFSGKIVTRVRKYKKPASNVNSTLMMHRQEGVWHDGAESAFTLFHAPEDMPMNLNHKVIKVLTRDVNLRPNGNIVELDVMPIHDDHRVEAVMNSLGGLPFPAKLPTSNTAKLIRGGFIPLLPSYTYQRSLLTPDQYISMIKRIVALIIKRHVPMIYREDPLVESRLLVFGLQHYLQLFFPGCIVEAWITTKQFEIFSYDRDCPTMSLIFLYSQPLSTDFLTISLNMKYCTRYPLTIGRFIELYPLVFPNVHLLNDRGFSGMSTTIYNNAISSKNIPIDIKPFVYRYLTVYSTVRAVSPRARMVPGVVSRYKNLLLRSAPFVLKKGERLLALLNVAYDPNKVIAYGGNVLHTVHFPFMLMETTDKKNLKVGERAFEVITVDHVDAAEIELRLVISTTFDEQ